MAVIPIRGPHAARMPDDLFAAPSRGLRLRPASDRHSRPPALRFLRRSFGSLIIASSTAASPNINQPVWSGRGLLAWRASTCGIATSEAHPPLPQITPVPANPDPPRRPASDRRLVQNKAALHRNPRLSAFHLHGIEQFEPPGARPALFSPVHRCPRACRAGDYTETAA
jgi:hypothetical protein